MTIAEAVSQIKNKLAGADIDTPFLDAQLIVGKGTGMTRVQILTYPDKILSETEICKINEMCAKRIKRMPMQYILGVCEFMGLEFKVNEHTLIPRGDTEILAEEALRLIKEKDYKTVLDIGTGSGAIAVSIAKFTDTKVTAIDISQRALTIAKENAEKNGVNVKFIESDLFAEVTGRFDLIVSNPPYIEKDIIKTLDPDVRDYEPLSALDGGRDGLDFYRKISVRCNEFLNKNGSLIFEIGYNQGSAVCGLLEGNMFEQVSIKRDLAGLDRVVIGYKIC